MSLELTLTISFLIILILGTLLHFTHDWFQGKGLLLHLFSALNESTWEHMKLLLFPTLLVILFQYFMFRNTYGNLWNAWLVLLVVEMSTMPLVFELLRVAMKKVTFWITITIFVLSIVFGILAEYFVLKNNFFILNEIFALIAVCVIVFLFFVFSFNPPRIWIFKDPIKKKYGDLN